MLVKAKVKDTNLGIFNGTPNQIIRRIRETEAKAKARGLRNVRFTIVNGNGFVRVEAMRNKQNG